MDGVRSAMVSYWQSYQPTLESMLLDSNASSLSVEEQQEILSYLPEFRHLEVLELGAGIGRFTGRLAREAKRVLAVDFMKEFVKKNAKLNGHLGNVEFLEADVTRLELPDQSFDVVFTNWLLMYLDEEEVLNLVLKTLSWLRDGGFLFVRESCFHSSGKGVSRPLNNPTFYRNPSFYVQLFRSAVLEKDGRRSCFQLIRANSLKTYAKYKNNPNQLCFLLRKVDVTDMSIKASVNFQSFLDENQYTRKNILRYERIFGSTFVCPGGRTNTEEFCKYLDLKTGERVLDVGCGIGGGAFHMAKTYGVNVYGVDLSSNMITIALEKQMQEQLANKICFEMSDITGANYPESSFDVIYSRDTILHIDDKRTLFSRFWKWLRPGGRLLISDYCRGELEQTVEFREHVTRRCYHLLTIADCAKLLTEVGFFGVRAEDRTSQFVDDLKMELDGLHRDKTTFVKDFSLADFNELTDGWNAKMQWCLSGNLFWGLFLAEKQKNKSYF